MGAATKTVAGEHRSGAYIKYVSTGAQPDAVCSPASRDFREVYVRSS